MYTLTEICKSKENVSFHQKLGESFSVIERECSPNEFLKAYNCFYNYKKEPKENVSLNEINQNAYAIVVSEGGKSFHLLTKENFYYIVTENGKTFKNLTFK